MQRAILLLLLLLLAAMPPVDARPSVSVESLEIPSWDGTVLGADLYWTEAAVDEPVPAILMTHGWAGSRADLVAEARWLAGAGYVVLAYDSRGFGASEGTVGLNGPEEWADASHLVSWLSRQQDDAGPKVLLDDAETEDPRLGMYGYSYGGAIQLLAAAEDERIDAIVPDITWNDLRKSLAPNTVVKRGWVDLLFWGGMLGAHGASQGNPNTGGMDERLREWYFEALQTGRLPASADDALGERSPARYLEHVSADVLLTQGWRDTLFDPDEATRTYAGLAGREDAATHLLFHPAGHGHAIGGPHKVHFEDEILRFYAKHLDDAPVDALPAVQWHDAQADLWQVADAWPPAAVANRTVGSRGGAEALVAQAPPPTSHTETQQLQGTLGPSNADAPLPTGTRVRLDVDGPVALVGAPVVRLNVTPSVDDLTLFFSLVDVPLEGEGRVVANQVTAWRVEGQAGATVDLEVPLVPVAHTVQSGRSLFLRVTTSDSAYLGARESGTVVLDLSGLQVDLPVYDRDAAAADGDPEMRGGDSADAPGLPPIFLPLVGFLWVAWLRRRGPRSA